LELKSRLAALRRSRGRFETNGEAWRHDTVKGYDKEKMPTQEDLLFHLAIAKAWWQ